MLRTSRNFRWKSKVPTSCNSWQLLARLEKESDANGLKELGYPMIEIVACNLYPFSDAASTEPPLEDLDLLEMIDIEADNGSSNCKKSS